MTHLLCQDHQMAGSTFVLVPGAGGNAHYWSRLVPLLRAGGHGAVAVDLPNWPGATLADQSDAISTAAGRAADVVLVAQSMGGFSAPLACDGLPVRRLVLLNAMIPVPGETPGQWWEHTRQAEARRRNDVREGRDPDADFDLATYFLHDLTPEVIKETEDSAGELAESLFACPFDLLGWPAVPTNVLSGRDDRFFPYEFQQWVAQERLGLPAEQIPGGHLVALSQPDAVASRLLELG